MAVKITLRDQDYQVKPKIALRDAILKIGLQPDSVLAIRNGELITDDEILLDGNEIKLIAVISGGIENQTIN